MNKKSNSNNNLTLLDTFKQASKDLLFMSESDYPFETFFWQAEDKQTNINANLILQKTEHPPNTPVQFIDIDSFFTIATTEQDWHNSEDKETIKKYQNLVKVIKDNLTDITIARLGKIEIDVYIIGKTANSDFAGLLTKVIET